MASPQYPGSQPLNGHLQSSPGPSAGEYTPVANGRKRKADGTSSRGVANLTPEQLAKKRANDREAQRAIRERTKNQIETLERRIKELESQQPFQELQNVIRSRDAIQAENEDLRRRLASILALVQPVHAQQVLNGEREYMPLRDSAPDSRSSDIAAAAMQQSPLPHSMQPPPAYPQQSQGGYDQQQNFTQHHLHPDLRNPHPSPSAATPQHAQQNNAPPNASRPWSPSPNSVYQQQLAPSAPMENSQNADRGGLNFLLDHDQRAKSLIASPPRGQPAQTDQQYVPPYARLPQTISPTCSLDQLLLDCLAERRQAAARGATSSTLIGPAYPSISSLLNPDRAAQAHPLSQVFTNILTKFPNLSNLPEQVAVLYIMFLLMRWHVAPTQENFDRVPEWIRPTKSQVEIPHPAWIDYLPW